MKICLEPHTCLAPLPAVIVTCGDEEENNAITLAWVGTVNAAPPILSIAVRDSRYSLGLIERTKQFTVNLVDRSLLHAMDVCGVTSGRDVDKFAAAGITRAKGERVGCPYVAESPVSIECKVVERVDFPTHAVFFGEIVGVIADAEYTRNGKVALPDGFLVTYANGKYLATGEQLGSYGYTAKETK